MTAKQKIEYFENLKDYIGSAEKANLIVAPSVIGISDVTLNAQLVRLNDLYTKKAIAKEKNPRTVIIDQEINNTLNFLGENIKNRLANSRSELKSLDSRIKVPMFITSVKRHVKIRIKEQYIHRMKYNPRD